MKRIWKTVAIVMVMVLLMGMVTPPVADAKSAGFQFAYKKVTVSVNGKAAKLIKKAGKPIKTTVKKSCAYKGKDRTYKYESFILYTYSHTDNGTEYVNCITFLDDSVSTKEGIHIGSTLSELKKAYGNAKDKFGIYTYKKGKTCIQFEVVDDVVANVRYVEA